jgi:hypothetical protein
VDVLKQRAPWLRVRSYKSLTWDYRNFRQYNTIINLLLYIKDQYPDREYFFGIGSLDEPQVYSRNVDIVISYNISSHAYRLFGALGARKWSESNDLFSDIFRRYKDRSCLRKRHNFTTDLDAMIGGYPSATRCCCYAKQFINSRDVSVFFIMDER